MATLDTGFEFHKLRGLSGYRIYWFCVVAGSADPAAIILGEKNGWKEDTRGVGFFVFSHGIFSYY